MAEKYVKPLVRNLGDIIPNAEGYCASGSVAQTTTGPLGCAPFGSAASGYGCATYGSKPATSCNIGFTPDNPSGCLTGVTPAY